MSERTLDSSAYWSSEEFAGRLARVALLVRKHRLGRSPDPEDLADAVSDGLAAIDAVVAVINEAEQPSLPGDTAQAILKLVNDGREAHAFLAEDIVELRERLSRGTEALRDEDLALLSTLAEQANLGAARAFRKLRRR